MTITKMRIARRKSPVPRSPKIFSEGKAKFYAFGAPTVSKKLPVFYNPAMAMNRDLTVLLLNSIPEDEIHLCDPLAGTGIRSLRLLLELKKGKIASLTANDGNPRFPALFKKNLALNKIPCSRVILESRDANLAMLGSNGFHYIDIDPFGSPNPFLDVACKRLARHGYLAVTATDTSALCGTFPEACRRKYWSVPRHDYLMHEAGLRILIRKVQLVAAQFEKALEPVYCYSHEHHMRVFFRAMKQKSAADRLLDQQGMWDNAGPVWLGRLWDPVIAQSMSSSSGEYPAVASLASTIAGESEIAAIGFADLHEIGRALKIGNLPPVASVLDEIRGMGYQAARTHLSGSGIRTTMPDYELTRLIKGISEKGQ